ncbi:MAG TPA: type III secretion system export apparatus subunit SctU [Burkholderiaceae bacterium]|nr:type III secretion system export apparatus subunit SctU [Burkholderiaceae bacterium]
MASDDSGDKTEQPTPKKLDDARKKGDVPKSKEVSSTVGLIVWLALGALTMTYATTRIGTLYESLFTVIGQGWATTGFAGAARALGAQAAELAVMLVAMLLVPIAAVGLLTDFLQMGPVLSFEKLTPKLENMNPVEGVKKMFTLDNLIELVKSVAKTALLFLVGWLVIKSEIPQIVGLARSTELPVQAMGALMWKVTLHLLAWTVALFALIALLDAAYQRYSFTKKMRMSMRDIKQEMKESEGDPYIKQQRKQLHQEWSQRNSQNAARNANVLVVNPTHIAIAIDYDKDSCPVPTIAAKGEEHVARAMREAAEEAGVPIVRNVALARDLLARAEIGEIVPADLFDIIAEVILWAREVREVVQAQRDAGPSPLDLPLDVPARPHIAAPGEDLTHYPHEEAPPWNRSH